jgi:threonine/homoserine/homoserine lactone efflux protein
MVTALLVGLVVGFVLAIPPGPIAMACVQQGLAGQARAGLALVLGASAMDIVYALLAAFASSALVEALWGLVLHHAWALLAFQGGCIVVLVVLGLRYCRSTTPGDAARARPEAQDRPRGDASPYLHGVLIALTNLANPLFLPSLNFVMSLVQVRGWVGHAGGDHVMYALGFGGGGALWFVLLLRTLTHLRAQVSPTVIPMLYRVAGGVFLLCAGMLTYHMVTTTAWARLPGW